MKKGEFSFVWLFAIFAGGLILFLAIYGAVRFGDTARYQTNTEVAKKITIITDPMQAGFADGSFGKIPFTRETKITNFCAGGEFGTNKISVSTKSDKKWSPSGEQISVNNKYIFSLEDNIGKEFYIFSKPFNFPFEVSDMLILISKNYCFINTPEEFSEDMGAIRVANIKIENCSDSDLRVCFDKGIGCDIKVYGTCDSNCESPYDEGIVEKEGKSLKFTGNLIYAAIFSDEGIYTCNVERLLKRAGKISEVFYKKTFLMSARGCNTNLETDLLSWRDAIKNATADEIISINNLAESIEIKNRGELCGIW